MEHVKSISYSEKFKGYFFFRQDLKYEIVKHKPDWILAYDTVALGILATFKLPHPTKIWYHNHDVVLNSEIATFSLLRIFKFFETHMLRKKVDLFTLPTKSRLSYFPEKRGNVKTLIIPNYPSSKIYALNYQPQQYNALTDNLRLIHQGVFLPNNFEELVKEIQNSELKVELVLAGPMKESVEKVTGFDQRRFLPMGRLAYKDLPKVTKTCHVGLALYGDHNVMVRTVSTASNKIFEYIALGLPVVFTDREDFRALFGHYKWANYVCPDYSNLHHVLINISDNYTEQTKSARYTFEKERNFEMVFSHVYKYLNL